MDQDSPDQHEVPVTPTGFLPALLPGPEGAHTVADDVDRHGRLLVQRGLLDREEVRARLRAIRDVPAVDAVFGSLERELADKLSTDLDGHLDTYEILDLVRGLLPVVGGPERLDTFQPAPRLFSGHHRNRARARTDSTIGIVVNALAYRAGGMKSNRADAKAGWDARQPGVAIGFSGASVRTLRRDLKRDLARRRDDEIARSEASSASSGPEVPREVPPGPESP